MSHNNGGVARSTKRIVSLLCTGLVGLGLACTWGISQAAAGAHSKLIVVVHGFSCATNDFTVKMCAGFQAAAKLLPSGYVLEQKSGTNFADQTALNNLIQTSLLLHPAGVIVFSGGPAAQVPVLTRACKQGAKVFILDSDMPKLTCRTELLETNNYQAGVTAAQWLIAHPTKSKQVGVVNFPPGQFTSNDARLAGFRATVDKAGYSIVQTVSSSGDISQTRSLVTNMLVAHPSIGAIFSTTDFFGAGTVQAMKAEQKMNIEQVTIDGDVQEAKLIPNGGINADIAQDPYGEATQAVSNMVKALGGQSVPKLVTMPTLVVDAGNVKQYVAEHGEF
jgi:ABC-type sugar transport system substrate-binding protein